ncbi:MAG TPA: beta-galactosidase [Acidimicrobiales bacterium]|nr:beta-galactosidase [Acidimicrobiales bacterium]
MTRPDRRLPPAGGRPDRRLPPAGDRPDRLLPPAGACPARRLPSAGLAALTAGAAVTAALASEARIARRAQPVSDRWQRIPVEPRGDTRIGLSFRPRQAETFGLEPRAALHTLLGYPWDLVRLGAYWNRIEATPGAFDTSELDWQVEAADAAGRQIVLCVGPVKTFGYPEYFVPEHRLPDGLPEHRLVRPRDQKKLLAAATNIVTRIVERYRGCDAVVAWQVEHDAVDPLGFEHSWRLSAEFVRREVGAVRLADPSRPVLMNGFLPTSTPVRAQQWWRTRDQGDSLAVAADLADIVGIDFYPRHALVGLGPWSLYLSGQALPWQQAGPRRLRRWAAAGPDRGLMVIEGQAEPWETTTTPPSPGRGQPYSCRPEHLISNYNHCLRWGPPGTLDAYLLWGAEYWLQRARHGDPSYLQAFRRLLEES